MNNQLNDFYNRYNFIFPKVPDLTKAILADMEKGLATPAGKPDSADQPMIVASRTIPNSIPSSSSAIVIDAGGTNFRSCLVTIDAQGNYSIRDLEKTRMPAVDREMSKEEFYDAIASNLDHLKNKASRIGFCFSYAMEITKDGDGKVLYFSKEVKAPEAIGTYVGAELKKALEKRGWNSIEKITLLNDTTASLLAGTIGAPKGQTYSSYVGFILGTGLNNAYIDYEPVKKLTDDNSAQHIIVCEGGFFKGAPQSTFDKELDAASAKPGQGLLEKMCSGAYMGTIVHNALKHACSDGLFSKDFCNALAQTDSIMPVDMDMYFKTPQDTSLKIGKLAAVSSEDDVKLMVQIMKDVISRSAIIVASLLCASILKSGKGTDENNPICIVGNGTTFWKTTGLYPQICQLLEENLKGEWKRFYQIIQVENDITLGTCAAAFM